MNKVGVYIHIPFCRSKCAYCAFTSFQCREEMWDRYIDGVVSEINRTIDKSHIVDTVYIGGGTPSILPAEYIERIISALKTVSVYQPREVTIECNPESITEDKIAKYSDIGINRISMGVQSINDKVLKTIGRIHTASEAIDKAKLVKKYGFNLSVDMILGLPLSTLDDIRNYIETFTAIGVNHVSAYSLSVEKGTRLYEMAESHKIDIPSDDEAIEQYDLAYRLLKEKGFHRYEVSNFARQGYESQHNNKYWQMDEYIGIGVASHSYIDGERHFNPDSIEEYLSSIDDGKKTYMLEEKLTLRDRVEETVMLGLRLEKGVSIAQLDNLVGGSFVELDRKNLDKVKDYIVIDKEHIRIKPEYMNVMNTIIIDILE